MPLTLVEATKVADSVRKSLIQRKDPLETGQWAPPGTWQGVATFVATGLLLTPFRRSALMMTKDGPMKGFLDLVITPVLAVGAAQVGLVVGTLHGSSHYLDRLAAEAATTTKQTTSDHHGSSNEFVSVRVGPDDKITYSPTTQSLAEEREGAVTELCRELLSMSSSPPPSSSSSSPDSLSQTSLSSANKFDESPFGSWDPRLKAMQSLIQAVKNCRRREEP